MMVEITPLAIENIYYKFYIILAVTNTLNAVCIYLFYPETTRLSLEELDFFFAKKYGHEADVVAAEKVVSRREDELQVETVLGKEA